MAKTEKRGGVERYREWAVVYKAKEYREGEDRSRLLCCGSFCVCWERLPTLSDRWVCLLPQGSFLWFCIVYGLFLRSKDHCEGCYLTKSFNCE